MKTIETGLDGVLLVEPKVFRDGRGFFFESYTRKKYQENGIDFDFVQDNHSCSSRGTLRGLHFQVREEQAKLVRVIQGEIFDVAVDIRKGSPSYGKWVGQALSAQNMRQMFIPAGFAHGFCVVSDTAEVLYKASNYYAPENERGIIWNDPDIAIDWPLENPILSEKDKNYPRLKDI